MPTRVILATPPSPGAIAIVQIVGEACEEILQALTGMRDWPVGRCRLADLAGFDEGLAVRLSSNVAQIMPHGGIRVVQRLTQRLVELNVTVERDIRVDPTLLFPEAADRIEALMLLALSRVESPLAINLLRAQPQRWRAANRARTWPFESDVRASAVLNRLITPPLVALVGRPNVGKSTLSNALLGRAMSIAADVPGTTRDYVAGRIDLGGLVVDWHDTPGVREDAGAVERRAINIARGLLARADLIVAMRDPDTDWPTIDSTPHLWVMNKVDDAPEHAIAETSDSAAHPLRVSARHGIGLAALATAVRDKLVSNEHLQHAGLWLFDDRLINR